MINLYTQSAPGQAAGHGAIFYAGTATLLMFMAGLAGCVTTLPVDEEKIIQVCVANECNPAGLRYSSDQLLHALDQLFLANDGVEMRFCDSDPVSRVCTGDDVGYFILGGFIPGRGSSSSGKASQVQLDAVNRSIHYVMAMNLRFLGLPLICADHNAVLQVNSVHNVTITDNSYLCTWMVMGIMTASFGFEIDSVDLDHGQLGGYWKHGVTGTGNGRGHGYALIKFKNTMPNGENWLARK